jgi:hypothetical protein
MPSTSNKGRKMVDSGPDPGSHGAAQPFFVITLGDVPAVGIA